MRPLAALIPPVSTSFMFLVYLILALFGLLFGCAPAPTRPSDRQLQMIGLVQKFDRFDHNGDGYLTRKELEDGLRAEGSLSLTPAELNRVMAAYDINHDKRISRHEAQLGADRGPIIFEQAQR
jgi:hypothetical protein